MNIETKLSTAFVNKCFELCRGYPTHKSFHVRENDINAKITSGVRAWHVKRKRWVDVVAGMGGMLRVQWFDIARCDDGIGAVHVPRSTICVPTDLILPYGRCELQSWYVEQAGAAPSCQELEQQPNKTINDRIFLRSVFHHRAPKDDAEKNE